MLFQSRHVLQPVQGSEVQELLFAIADQTNDGLLPNGRLRTWEVPYSKTPTGDDGFLPPPDRPILPADLPAKIEQFCQTVGQRWGELANDPVPLAAWAEWHLNAGPLHPFYDGCGRISKSFAALILIRAGWLLPLYEDRQTYFHFANRGPTAFADYVRERIQACAKWIGGKQEG